MLGIRRSNCKCPKLPRFGRKNWIAAYIFIIHHIDEAEIVALERYCHCGCRAVSILRHYEIGLACAWMLPVVLVGSIHYDDYICDPLNCAMGLAVRTPSGSGSK